MKKLFFILIIFSLALLFIGCSKDNVYEESLFYSLKEAYNNNFLAKEDLLNILYYYSDETRPVYPINLNSETEYAIKETRVKELKSRINTNTDNITVNDVEITGFYGEYNGSYVLFITDSYTSYIAALGSEVIDGITFYYNDSNRIVVWKEGTKDSIISYSLDRGKNFQKLNNELEEFDIWNVDNNDKNSSMVFFWALTYDDLLEQVEKYKNPDIYTYNYYEEDDWDNLIKTYDKNYFKNYALLFYYKYEPNISENYVYNVVINNNKLTLNINRFESYLTALSSWLELITIKKTDIKDVTEFNVSVRTISILTSSISFSITKDYVRDIYLNGLDIADFQDLNNLKSVYVYTSSLSIDLIFNEVLSSERLNEILNILENLDTIKSIGYTSNEWIRVAVDNRFYDKVVRKILTLDEIIGDKIAGSDTFTITIRNFSPLALVRLTMEKHGKYYLKEMEKQLRIMNYPFLDYKIEHS